LRSFLRASAAIFGAWALIAACSGGKGTNSSGEGSGAPQGFAGRTASADPLDAGTAPADVQDSEEVPFPFGTSGPWPTAPVSAFGAAQGFDELPIVDVSTDEAQNLWAVSHSALYLWRPGESRARKYTAADGLHLDNAMPPGITAVCGGAPGEVFVGYQGAPIVDPQHDALRFKGKLDRALLEADGSLAVTHYDVHNNDLVGMDSSGNVIRLADGGIDPELTDWSFNEDRTVIRFLYDHLYHRGELYVAYTHGVGRFRAGKPDPVSGFDYVDHIHPVVANAKGTNRMGDWRALALDPSTRTDYAGKPAEGVLWMGGRWTAGAATWTPGLYAWGRNELNPFYVAFTSPPVFPVPQGEDVFIDGIAALSDGSVYFGSLIGLGIARWRAKEGFIILSPQRDLGLPGDEILDLQRLPDDTVLVQQSGGIFRWNPQPEPRGQLSGPLAGIPGSIQRIYIDPMVSPAAAWIATDAGIALLRLP
jgi:hypothetical protein